MNSELQLGQMEYKILGRWTNISGVVHVLRAYEQGLPKCANFMSIVCRLLKRQHGIAGEMQKLKWGTLFIYTTYFLGPY